MAFHNASLTVEDRKAVEKAYLDGHITIICCTSTLAVGVNLPCYLVVLKGTQGYGDAGLQEYSSLEIMQMLGRAGRPGLESEACALILCPKERAQKYEKMVAGEEVLESSLHLNLVEHLNAEIGLGTITDLNSAKSWLKSTFLNVRLQQNPQYYNAESDNRYTNPEEVLAAWCEKDLALLEESDLVRNNGTLRCTEYGEAMARYCVKLESMQAFMALSAHAKLSEVLDTLCQAHEFQEFRWKAGEKTIYKEINQSNEVRYPIKGSVEHLQQKVSILIQAKLGAVPLGKDNKNKNKLNGAQIRQLQIDTSCVLSHAKRLIRCMVDILIHKGDSVATRSALELRRSLAAGSWDDTVLQLKQISGLGDVSVRKLAAANIKNIDALFNTEPGRVEVILSKHPPYGHELLKKLAEFPMLHVSAQAIDKKRQDQKGVEVKLKCQVGFVNTVRPTSFNKKPFNVLFLCETSYGELVHFQRFWPTKLREPAIILLTAMVVQADSKIRCHVMCDDVAGTHRFAEVSVDCPASWFQRKRTILDPTSYRTTLLTEPSAQGENFDLEGVDDSDLLEAAERVKTAEEVVDINDVEAGPVQKDKVDRGTKRLASAGKNQESRWREPKQLPNGNWTCQHDCAVNSKQCKHPCCLNGVKRKPTASSAKRQKQSASSGATSTASRTEKEKMAGCKPGRNDGPLDRMLAKSKTFSADVTQSVKPAETIASSSSKPDRNVRAHDTAKGAAPQSSNNGFTSSFDLSGLSSDTIDFENCGWESINRIAAQHDDVPTTFASAIRNQEVPGFFDTFTTSFDQHNNPQVLPSQAIPQARPPQGDQAMFMSADSSPRVIDDKPWVADNPDSDFSFDEPGLESTMSTYQCSHSSDSAKDSAFISEASRTSNTSTISKGEDAPDQLQSDIIPDETPAEREHRLYIEDQKRRWAEIPCNEVVNYENFGSFIQIVDDTDAEN